MSLPVLPTEVWECVIDHLAYAMLSQALKNCTLVCKAWFPRSRYHYFRRVFLREQKRVVRLAELVKTSPIHGKALLQVLFKGGQHPGGQHKPIPEFGTFAAMLARRLPNLRQIGITYADWQPATFHPQIFVHLSAFTSVTQLTLYSSVFSSVDVFGRLVCSLPNLSAIATFDLTFLKRPFNSRTFYAPRTNIVHVSFNGSGVPDVVDFFVQSRIASQLREMLLGYPRPVLSARTDGLQDLLSAAGAALRVLDITVVGSALKSANSDDSGIHVEEGIVRSDALTQPPADLTHNTSLLALHLKMRLIEDVDYTWIIPMLTQIHSADFRNIVFLIDARYGTALSRLSENILTPDICSSVDALLATKQFSKLQEVHFKLWLLPAADAEKLVASEWHQTLCSKMPKLTSRGILLSNVDVTYRALPSQP